MSQLVLVALAGLLAVAGCSGSDEPVADGAAAGAGATGDDSSSDGSPTTSGGDGPATDGGDTGSSDTGGTTGDSIGDSTGDSTGGDTGGEDCLTHEQFFAQRVWAPLMSSTCIACHSSAGAAKDTKLVLKSEAWPGWLDHNMAVVREVSSFQYEGTSILLLKPTAQIPHVGGELIDLDGEHYLALEDLIQRFATPDDCVPTPIDESGFYAGVTTLDAAGTFRKAALALGRRAPTIDESTFLQVNGDAGLESTLDALLAEDGFYDSLKVAWNDLLLTDRYDRNSDALNLLNTDDYPNRTWYDDDDYPADPAAKALGQQHTNHAVARAPLDLIAWVVRNELPFARVLTADHMVVNPFSAHTYDVPDTGFADVNDPDELQPASIAGVPHAGILTDPMFLNRFPTTDTNRNRHRSRMVWKLFLATDILALAEQPIDPTSIEDHNPTLFNPACTVCHELVDPIAGTFQNWSAQGRYLPPENGWHPDMIAPGFEDQNVPFGEHGSSLQWLADRITGDDRFPVAVTQMAFTMLTGQLPMRAPSEADESIPSPEAYEARLRAWQAQSAFLQDVADAFVADDSNFKTAVKRIVLSPWFRAEDLQSEPDEVRAEELRELGTARLLTPEALSAKLEALTGYPWRNQPHHTDYLLDNNQYRVFYGGIDSNQVNHRITEPGGVMIAVQTRMANEMACRAVPQDLGHVPSERKLFPLVQTTFLPEDGNGFEIPQATDAIRENIRHLFRHLLGEHLAVDDPEVEAAYVLWYQTWSAGVAAIEADEESTSLHWSCRGQTDWWTGGPYEDQYAVTQDPNYTVRAWMAVISYLLTDYRFVFE